MSERAKRIKGHSELDESMICYWKASDGSWMLWLPDNRVPDFNGLLGGLKLHKVEEHEDGTITVSPSILVSNRNITRHGFLKRGIWTEC